MVVKGTQNRGQGYIQQSSPPQPTGPQPGARAPTRQGAARTQSGRDAVPSQGKPADSFAVEQRSSTQVRPAAATGPAPADPSVARTERRPALPPPPPGGRWVALTADKPLAAALAEHYGEPVSPGLAALVLRMQPPGADVENGPVVLYDNRALYKALHPQLGDMRAQDVDKILDGVNLHVVQPGQSWEQLFAAAFAGCESLESLDRDARALLITLVAGINNCGPSRIPPPVVAVPDLPRLAGMVKAWRDQHAVRQHRCEAARGEAERQVQRAVSQYGGSLDNAKSTPTAGAAYRATSGEKLSDVVLFAYQDRLRREGLTAEQADLELQYMVVVVAGMNGLTTTDLSVVDKLWLPPAELVESMASDTGRADMLARVAKQQPELWAEVSGEGVQARVQAEALRTHQPRAALTAEQLDQAVERAPGAVMAMAWDRSLSGPSASLAQYGVSLGFMDALLIYSELYGEEPPERIPGETDAQFLQRAYPNLSPEAMAQQVRHAKVVRPELDAMRARLDAAGMLNDSSRLVLEVRDGESIQAAVSRAGAGLDPTTRERLIAALEARHPSGFTGTIDADPVSLLMLHLVGENRTRSTLDPTWFKEVADPRGTPEEIAPITWYGADAKYESRDNVVTEITTRVARGVDVDELTAEVRKALQVEAERLAALLAQVKGDALSFEKTLKAGVQEIERWLRAGKAPGGPPPSFLVSR